MFMLFFVVERFQLRGLATTTQTPRFQSSIVGQLSPSEAKVKISFAGVGDNDADPAMPKFTR